MKKRMLKIFITSVLALSMAVTSGGCGKKAALSNGEMQVVDKASLEFPLKEKKTIKGLTSYPANT